MTRPFFFLLLALGLLLSTGHPLAGQNQSEPLKKKIVQWGLNKNVTVKLTTGDIVTGRIAEIRETGFSVQTVELGQVTTRQIHFHEVQSVRAEGETNLRTVTRSLAFGAGVVFTVLAVISLTRSNNHPQPVFTGK